MNPATAFEDPVLQTNSTAAQVSASIPTANGPFQVQTSIPTQATAIAAAAPVAGLGIGLVVLIVAVLVIAMRD